jgi:hypothetical protein
MKTKMKTKKLRYDVSHSRPNGFYVVVFKTADLEAAVIESKRLMKEGRKNVVIYDNLTNDEAIIRPSPV